MTYKAYTTGPLLSHPALQPQPFSSFNKPSSFLPQVLCTSCFICQEQSPCRSLHGWFLLLILVSAQTSPPHGGVL